MHFLRFRRRIRFICERPVENETMQICFGFVSFWAYEHLLYLLNGPKILMLGQTILIFFGGGGWGGGVKMADY